MNLALNVGRHRGEDLLFLKHIVVLDVVVEMRQNGARQIGRQHLLLTKRRGIVQHVPQIRVGAVALHHQRGDVTDKVRHETGSHQNHKLYTITQSKYILSKYSMLCIE